MDGRFEILDRKVAVNRHGQCKTNDDVLDLETDIDTGEPIICSKKPAKHIG